MIQVHVCLTCGVARVPGDEHRCFDAIPNVHTRPGQLKADSQWNRDEWWDNLREVFSL